MHDAVSLPLFVMLVIQVYPLLFLAHKTYTSKLAMNDLLGQDTSQKTDNQ